MCLQALAVEVADNPDSEVAYISSSTHDVSLLLALVDQRLQQHIEKAGATPFPRLSRTTEGCELLNRPHISQRELIAAEAKEAMRQIHCLSTFDSTELELAICQFESWAHIVEAPMDADGPLPSLIVIDCITPLLSPLLGVTSGFTGHVFMMDICNRLRRLAVTTGAAVLITDNVVSDRMGPTSRPKPALGPCWASATDAKIFLSRAEDDRVHLSISFRYKVRDPLSSILRITIFQTTVRHVMHAG